ncbi:hypothetical protein HT031_004292 [Scenedesmus sp. PABB004]|nr:hypothetical protein HT031_004292 [Scenedesmus sp. PABB004]
MRALLLLLLGLLPAAAQEAQDGVEQGPVAAAARHEDPAAAPLARLDLSSGPWALTSANGSVHVRAARLPAHVLGLLAAAGVVAADPLAGYGELTTRWVAEETWNLTHTWAGARHGGVAAHAHALLVLHGVDTFGTALLNGRPLATTDNAHRAWWLPLAPGALRGGANTLSLVLRPAAAAALAAKAAHPYAIPTMAVPGGLGAYNFARKPASDFGWDWGPAFVPAGVTGAVELVGFSRAALIGALVHQQSLNGSAFQLTVTGQLLVPQAGDCGELRASLPGLGLEASRRVALAPGEVGGNALQALASVTLVVPASSVRLWQPAGRLEPGQAQALYTVVVTFWPGHQPQAGCGAAAAAARRAGGASSVRRRVGFRTVELVRQPVRAAAAELVPGARAGAAAHSGGAGAARPAGAGRPPAGAGAGACAAPSLERREEQAAGEEDEQGESFYFRVNGQPLFAKGANLVPLAVLSTAVSDGAAAAAARDAAAAGMNMLRVWGGGLYQRDAFYDAADELGLLIWQEAMFACSPYPRDPAFVANVEAELVQQVLRLGGHASVALWGGNNEVEASLEWYDDTRRNLALYAVDYSALFVDAAGRTVQQMLPGAAWVDGSPSNGLVPAARSAGGAGVKRWGPPQSTKWAAPRHHALPRAAPRRAAPRRAAPRRPHAVLPPPGLQQRYGDVHYYNYGDDCQDWTTYPAARFVSEHGWQSYPSWAAYAAATGPADWRLDSAMTEFRQRHPNGTAQLLAQLRRRFRLPPAWQRLLPPPPPAGGAWRRALAGAARAARAALARLLPGRSAAARARAAAGAGGGAGGGATAGGEVRSWIYLTQLQQALCYETAFARWRRLRAEPRVLTMGVLYWQLNDVWAGASWSTVDVGGVWKPAHHAAAAAFSDLALSVQHNLTDGGVDVYVVSDLLAPAAATLTVRLLSLDDSTDACGPDPSPSAGASADAPCAPSAGWARHCEAAAVVVPPGGAALAWSGSAASLLAAARGCTARTCYVHVRLASPGRRGQEATVWLAPFAALRLPRPGLALSGFRLDARGGDRGGGGPWERGAEAAGGAAAVEFTVSSARVAAYAVWEVSPGWALPGRFSDNAATVHPCEPQRVRFVPRGGAAPAGVAGRALLAAPPEGAGGGAADGDALRALPRVLAAALSASSLYDHQQF